MQDLLSQ